MDEGKETEPEKSEQTDKVPCEEDGEQKEPFAEAREEDGEQIEPFAEPREEDGKQTELFAEPCEEGAQEREPWEDDRFREIKELLERGEIAPAQAKLDEFNERGAEWHYIQSLIYRKQNWMSEARKSLERALSFEPDNETYKSELQALDDMAESGKKSRKRKGKRALGGEGSVAEGCVGACADCCATIGCELLCEAICDGF